MTSILSTALSGLQSAALSADRAAARVARAGAETSASGATPAVIDATGSTPDEDPLQGMLDFRAAALAYKANAKVVGAADEMEKTLIGTIR